MTRAKTHGYYPVFAQVQGRACVVIGGGLIAQRKTTTLLGYGAQVTVISPTITARLAAYAKQSKIRHVARRFRPTDLHGAWLVYASTNDQQVNELVYRSATHRRIWTNVVDQKPLCSFIAPAILRRGPLTVAVSTGGASPSIAKKIRSDIGRMIGADYTPMLSLLAGLRGIAKQKLPSYQDRKAYFDRLARGPVFGLVRAGKKDAARREALSLLNRAAASRNDAGH